MFYEEDEDEKEITLPEVKKTTECLEALDARISSMQIINEEVLEEMFSENEDGDHMNDLGSEFVLGENPENQHDISKDAIGKAISDLIDQIAEDYEEDSSIDAVYDAVSSLVEGGLIPDMPSEVASDEEKIIWVQNYMPKVKERLVELGIEFDTEA